MIEYPNQKPRENSSTMKSTTINSWQTTVGTENVTRTFHKNVYRRCFPSESQLPHDYR